MHRGHLRERVLRSGDLDVLDREQEQIGIGVIRGVVELVEDRVVIAHGRDLDDVRVVLAGVPHAVLEVADHHADVTVSLGVGNTAAQEVEEALVLLTVPHDLDREAVLVLLIAVEVLRREDAAAQDRGGE